ncbi:MAG: hypothetical protein C0490_21545 [Marivirga sp.]|nr:hypothetical protein [Marivirga sp.]
MKQNVLLLIIIVILIGGCTSHQHDGLYIANMRTTGITQAWILEGDYLTIYSAGMTKVMECNQYNDRLKVEGDEVFYFDDKGDILMPDGKEKGIDYRMTRISDKTKYSQADLDKLIDEAYEKERKTRLGIKPE